MVRIPGFHPGGPGSIPGVGIFRCNRIVVSTSRCGRDNPGSNPGYSTCLLLQYKNLLLLVFTNIYIINLVNIRKIYKNNIYLHSYET